MNIFVLPIQLFLSLFLLFAISRVFLRFKEGTISSGQFLFWCGLWLLALFSIFYPDFSNYWARLLGIGRGADAILYTSVIALFYLVFRLHVLLENVNYEISKLVREVALLSQEQTRRQPQKQKAKR